MSQVLLPLEEATCVLRKLHLMLPCVQAVLSFEVVMFVLRVVRVMFVVTMCYLQVVFLFAMTCSESSACLRCYHLWW